MISFFKSLFYFSILAVVFSPSPPLEGAEEVDFNQGRILFLLQQGEHQQGLKVYQEKFQGADQHSFELLHQIGLRILDSGFRQRDPESQLLALFGASIAAHEDAYYILEESIKNPQPTLQLVALNALARFQNDRADQAIMRALGSSSLEVRYEAAHQLCKKKHRLAVSQTESLMYKTPTALLPIYPPLFAMVGDTHSTRVLRKLLNHSSKDVRLAVILSVAKYQRDDLLPQIRQQALQQQFALQEAAAFTLGVLKDEESTPRLEKLIHSQYPAVALAAQVALYELGKQEAITAIEQAALGGDIFAITALGSIPDHSAALLKLTHSTSLQLRLNAIIALLQQQHPQGLEQAEEIILRDKQDLAFTSTDSPGKTFKGWKVTPSSSQLLKEDLKAYGENLELKEELLEKVSTISSAQFIVLAHKIFNRQQNELIPKSVMILQNLGTAEAITCLKEHQQQLGAPLVRHYCNLALYKLHEPGPYAEQLRQWVKGQNKTQLIRFEPFSPWELKENACTLTPEETSKLLIDTFETLAAKQDKQGIEALIEAISVGNHKNKYALAGLLLRATQ